MAEKEDNSFDYVRFTWADLNGAARCKIVTRPHVRAMTTRGVGVYGGALMFGPQSQVPVPSEVSRRNHGNMYAIPDTGTLHPLPWAGNKDDRVGEYFCYTTWPDGRRQGACPREVARHQVARLEERHLTLRSAFEMEFCLFNSASGRPAWDVNGLCANTLLSRYEPFLFQVEDNIRTAGVDMQTIQAEYAPGQCEITFAPQQGLKAADDFFLSKQGLKEMAGHTGLDANFMAKPFPQSAGSGAHFNHSLWDGATNLFHDSHADVGLSQLARHWMAGLLTHACALTALSNHTVNCYRRFDSDWLSSRANWGHDNRRTALRTKTLSPTETYIECRVPSAACNPYLVLAGTIAAGLDGIDQLLPCPEPGGATGTHLPASLTDALQALDNDSEMSSALGHEFIQWFIQCKSEVDLREFDGLDSRTLDTDYKKERTMYSCLL